MEIISEYDILQEKQRSSKFNEDELRVLNGLIKKYKHILLNKKTGQVTPKQREDAWQAINVEFNNDPACSVSRTITQLKNKWDYMKRNAKKEVAAFKKAHRQTGGGKGPTPLDDTTAILLDTVRESVEGAPSNFDSDNTISGNILVLENDSLEILTNPVTVTLPEEPSYENVCKPNLIKSTTTVTDSKQFQMKKRKLNMSDTPIHLSTPQYTRSKFVEVAEKKLKWLNRKEDSNNKKSIVDIEILEKKSESCSLEKKKLELECVGQSMDIEIKKLYKRKLELEIALLEKQINKHD